MYRFYLCNSVTDVGAIVLKFPYLSRSGNLSRLDLVNKTEVESYTNKLTWGAVLTRPYECTMAPSILIRFARNEKAFLKQKRLANETWLLLIISLISKLLIASGRIKPYLKSVFSSSAQCNMLELVRKEGWRGRWFGLDSFHGSDGSL